MLKESSGSTAAEVTIVTTGTTAESASSVAGMAGTASTADSDAGTTVLTFENYQRVTSGMKSLPPEWIPSDKELKVNGILSMFFEEGNKWAQEILPKSEEAEREDELELRDRKRLEDMLYYAWTQTKLLPCSPERANMLSVQNALGYTFANERLLLQAFTRKSYYLNVRDHRDEIEYELRGADYEVLELAGDSLLSAATYKVFLRQHARFLGKAEHGELYFCDYDEGELAARKQHYTSKEYLLNRCLELGFDKFIRFGPDDDQSKPDPKEDIMEAIVGAVAIDADWDMEVIEDVVERLLDIHLEFDPWDEKQDKFNILNSWWQKRFGRRPEYKTWKTGEIGRDGCALYGCSLAFPLTELDSERDWGKWIERTRAEDRIFLPRFDYDHETNTASFKSTRISRSEARSMCAEDALHFIKAAGLFMDLRSSGIEPRIEDAINQLQILHQRGYIGEVEYTFDDYDTKWECYCSVDTFKDVMEGESKKDAKKKAAFAVLVQIMRSGGVDNPAWGKGLDSLDGAAMADADTASDNV